MNIEIFDIKKYRNGIGGKEVVMHFPTLEKALVFASYMEEAGYGLSGRLLKDGGISLPVFLKDKYDSVNSCFGVSLGATYCYKAYYKAHSDEFCILEFDDFEWGDSSNLDFLLSIETIL